MKNISQATPQFQTYYIHEVQLLPETLLHFKQVRIYPHYKPCRQFSHPAGCRGGQGMSQMLWTPHCPCCPPAAAQAESRDSAAHL